MTSKVIISRTLRSLQPLTLAIALIALGQLAIFSKASTAHAASTLFTQCQNLFPSGQVPFVKEPGRDLCFDGFAVYYSPLQKKPIYVIEKLNKEQLDKQSQQERSERFYEEARLPAQERASLSDYRGSGYARGHNAPALNRRTPNGMAQSFSLANMMPQAPENNRGVWAKDVEKATFKYALRAAGDVFVYTGSVGNIGTIGKSRIVVPAYLFKLVYDPTSGRAWAYWIPNTNEAQITLKNLISYSELVQKTGIDFGLGNPSK